MLLYELFSDPSSGQNPEQELSNQIAQVLAQMAAAHVPHVSINAVIDRLRAVHSGLQVDRALVMQLCDPTKMKFVKSIEGDNLVLTAPSMDQAAETEDEQEKKAEKIKADAEKQASAEIKKKTDKPAPPPVKGSPI
jgi:hypothetical protein